MELSLRRPDDWHVHLRDGAVLSDVVPAVARAFARAIVMPNLRPPVTTAAEALAYRGRIEAAVPDGLSFTPLMTLYLTDRTRPEDVVEAARKAGVVACKLYPAGATTNSDEGVTSVEGLDEVLAAMAEAGVLLLVHGEVTHADVDIFDREERFLEEVLSPLVDRTDGLRIVLEHITTATAVDFVRGAPPRVGATITAHHLLHQRNAMLVGGIRPHFYCLPVLKREEDRQRLLEAATGEDPRFFLGTDSAPHARAAKETACGCAGCYTSPTAMELYAEAFEQVGRLDRLEAFASERGADFYGLPRNEDRLTLVREEWEVPQSLSFADESIVPFAAGRTLHWRLR